MPVVPVSKILTSNFFPGESNPGDKFMQYAKCMQVTMFGAKYSHCDEYAYIIIEIYNLIGQQRRCHCSPFPPSPAPVCETAVSGVVGSLEVVGLRGKNLPPCPA